MVAERLRQARAVYAPTELFGRNTESDGKQLRFGIREITYELSLLDSAGHLRRLEYSPTAARVKAEHVVDVSHEGMRNILPRNAFRRVSPLSGKRMEVVVSSLAPAVNLLRRCGCSKTRSQHLIW